MGQIIGRSSSSLRSNALPEPLTPVQRRVSRWQSAGHLHIQRAVRPAAARSAAVRSAAARSAAARKHGGGSVSTTHQTNRSVRHNNTSSHRHNSKHGGSGARRHRAEMLAQKSSAFDFSLPDRLERMHTIGHVDIQMRTNHITCSNQVVHDILRNKAGKSIDENINEAMQILCEASVRAKRGGFQFILKKDDHTYFMVSEMPTVMSVLDPSGGTRPMMMRVLVRVRDGSILPEEAPGKASPGFVFESSTSSSSSKEKTVASDATVVQPATLNSRTPTPEHLFSPSEAASEAASGAASEAASNMSVPV